MHQLVAHYKPTNSEANRTNDSITSNQRTHKGLRYFMKWSSLFCSTYKVLSPVRIPKAAIDPVSSLLPNALHAMGAWCAWGAIAWKGWCLSSILLLMSCMQLREKTIRRIQRTVFVVSSDCQERQHFRWICFRRCAWYQLGRSVVIIILYCSPVRLPRKPTLPVNSLLLICLRVRAIRWVHARLPMRLLVSYVGVSAPVHMNMFIPTRANMYYIIILCLF